MDEAYVWSELACYSCRLCEAPLFTKHAVAILFLLEQGNDYFLQELKTCTFCLNTFSL